MKWLSEPPLALKFITAPTRARMAAIRDSHSPMPRPTSTPSGTSSPIPGAMKRIRTSSAASAVATTKIIGHGTVPALTVPVSSSTVSTAVAMISSHGTMPVKKKSNTLPPVAENPATSTLIQSRNPPIRKSTPPPTISQSGVLNLLRSTCAPSASVPDDQTVIAAASTVR